ncbi:AMP-dependent synthetase/ligase [soil metagenome]
MGCEVLRSGVMSAAYETLVDIYSHSIKEFGPRELFGTKKDAQWKWTSYAEFGEMVEAFRAGLAGAGVARGDKVAVIADNRVEWAVIAYACFGIGAAMVPMYEAQHEKDWEFIVRDCEAKALFVANKTILEKSKRFLKDIGTLKTIVCLEEVSGQGSNVTSYAELMKAGKAGKPLPSIQPKRDDVATLIYTSGTTGNPKGVVLSHYNIASNATAIHEIFPMDKDDRSLSFLPWAHVFGQTAELHILFSYGASMALCEGTNKILENLAEVKPTILMSVPRIFNKIYQAVQKQIAEQPKPIQALVKAALAATKKERDGKRLTIFEHVALTAADKLVFAKVRARFGGQLRYAFSGGAAISKEVAEFIDSLGITVFEGYGLTETSPVVAANCPGERRIGSVGRAIPGVRIVVDPTIGTGQTQQGRPEGEIVVYGPCVMQGYHNRPEENAAVFTKDGGFRTGDQGYLDAHGFLYITGRIKEQYKLENGKYVVPSPLEEKLKLSPYVLNALVFGDNKPYNVVLLCANVDAVKKYAEEHNISGSGTQLLDNPRIRELFRKEIDTFSGDWKGFEAVVDFAVIDEDFTPDNGMLTPSLKVKRRKVMDEYGALLEGLYAKKREKKPSAAASA